MNACVFCQPELVPEQKVILDNDQAMFLQLEAFQGKGIQLEGAGVIVPKSHRKTVFDLTEEEWQATYGLLQGVKGYLDRKHQPDGYNVGWNCGEVEGQHIFHAHLHVLPRYKDEPLAGKGIRSMFKAVTN